MKRQGRIATDEYLVIEAPAFGGYFRCGCGTVFYRRDGIDTACQTDERFGMPSPGADYDLVETDTDVKRPVIGLVADGYGVGLRDQADIVTAVRARGGIVGKEGISA